MLESLPSQLRFTTLIWRVHLSIPVGVGTFKVWLALWVAPASLGLFPQPVSMSWLTIDFLEGPVNRSVRERGGSVKPPSSTLRATEAKAREKARSSIPVPPLQGYLLLESPELHL